MLAVPVKRVLAAGGFASAIAMSPLLGLAVVGASVHITADDCPPGQSNDVYTNGCVPDVAPGNGPLTERESSQPGGGYVGPAIPEATNAPSEQTITACNGSAQPNCQEQNFYGPQPVPNPDSTITSSP
ncbi:MAG: hypothetical protein WAM92_06375 [Mycobacterium sp.]